jgi:hypothetical protein
VLIRELKDVRTRLETEREFQEENGRAVLLRKNSGVR